MKLVLSIAALVFTPSCLMPSMTVAATAAAEKLAVRLRGHEDDHARTLQEDGVDADFQKAVCVASEFFDLPTNNSAVFPSNVTFSFAGLPYAAGDILIEADIDGDFSDNGEEVTFVNEDLIPFLRLGGDGDNDCVTFSGNVTVTASVFNKWKADSIVEFLMVVGGDADVFCDRNSLRITLTYESKSGVSCPAFPTVSPTVSMFPTEAPAP
jgi:hypothetical protein